MKAWISRDKGAGKINDSEVVIWGVEPVNCRADTKVIEYHEESNEGNILLVFDKLDFKRGFGFTPRKGTKEQVNIKIGRKL